MSGISRADEKLRDDQRRIRLSSEDISARGHSIPKRCVGTGRASGAQQNLRVAISVRGFKARRKQLLVMMDWQRSC